MNNFLEGLVAVSFASIETILRVTEYPLFWGFGVGFLTSTVVHGFLITDSPKSLPTVLFNDKSTSFEKLYRRNDNGAYNKSYVDFARQALKVKIIFGIAFSLLLILTIVGLFT